MLKVAITGGIASGKSTCLMHLMMQGYSVYSADSIAHDLLKNEAKEKVIEEFGTFILDEDGNISRRILAQVVFGDSDAIKKLEDIIHPMVRDKIIDIANKSEENIIFFEVPLLFESNMQDIFDYTINIYASEEEQIRRVMLRDNITEIEAKERIANQLPTLVKNKLASFCILADEKDKMYDELDKVTRRILNHEI